MKTLLIFLMLGLCNTRLLAQHWTGIYPSLGIVYQRELMADISLIKMNAAFPPDPSPQGGRGTGMYGTDGLRFGVETNFNPERLLLAPKIGLEYNVLIFLTRISLIDYWTTISGEHDLRLSPELGVSAAGTASLSFGYNIHFFGNRNRNISGAKLSLLFNLNRRLIKRIWGNKRH